MAANRVFTPQFRLSIVERVLKGKSVGVLSRELDIGRNVLYRWCDSYRREGVAGIERGTGRPPASYRSDCLTETDDRLNGSCSLQGSRVGAASGPNDTGE
jgi:transposase-like protein